MKNHLKKSIIPTYKTGDLILKYIVTANMTKEPLIGYISRKTETGYYVIDWNSNEGDRQEWTTPDQLYYYYLNLRNYLDES